jgi:hypothetical protein
MAAFGRKWQLLEDNGSSWSEIAALGTQWHLLEGNGKWQVLE